jgi:hypothetical protein
MPSRKMTLGIVVFWLGATGWMLYRDLWEKAGQPPPFTLDMADEVRTGSVLWDLCFNGDFVGEVNTTLKRTPQRQFELACKYLPNPRNRGAGGLPVRDITGTYLITPRGELRRVRATVILPLLWWGTTTTELEAEVRSGELFQGLAVKRNGTPAPPLAAGTGAREVLNVLHPLHKMAGLRAGRSWRTLLLNPLPAATRPHTPGLDPLRAVDATVTGDVLDWYGTRVACWRVDYLAGEQLALRVWVRVSDDTVLRQQIPLGGAELTLLRPPEGPRGSRHD